MPRAITAAALALPAIVLLAGADPAAAEKTVRVGWCAKTVTSAAAPYAIANKFGWFGDFKVQVVPMPSSTDCVKNVATREVPYANASAEPLMVIRLQDVKMKNFYTAYQTNIAGMAVPETSKIKSIKEIKGMKVGVIALGGATTIVAKALAAANGLDPEKDINIVVAGESAQTAALIRSKQVEVLCQFDTQYALVENAGVKLRMLDNSLIERFPSNGFVAYEEHLASNRAEAVALGRGYAMGTVWAMANPEAAIRILWEQFPQTRSTGKDEATALRDDLKTWKARAEHLKLEPAGVTKWGENSEKNYQDYIEFLRKWNVLKEPLKAGEIITNDLIDDINKFDGAKVTAEAKAYTYKN